MVAELAAMATEQNPAAETDADGAAVARDRVTALAARARAGRDAEPIDRNDDSGIRTMAPRTRV